MTHFRLSSFFVTQPVQKGFVGTPLMAVLVLAATFGLYTSFRYHFATWGLDPDSLQVGIIWMGIREHGLTFLKTYGFGPDNWLFSLILPSIPLWDLIGARPMAIVGLGWIAFVAMAFMVGVISRIFASFAAALGISAFFLLSNAETLGGFGFMSHPSSHDISLTWGLAVFLLFYVWQSRGIWAAFFAAFIILTADCISDPWAIIGIAVPSLVGAFVSLPFLVTRWRSAACILGVISALIVTETKAFGSLSFLTSNPIILGNWLTINSNFVWLTQSLGVIFNPIPGILQPFPLTVAITCACILLSTAWGSYVLLRYASKDGPSLWLAVTIILSATLPCLAFIVTVLPANLEVGRFVDSLIIFVPMIALSALSIEIGKTSRAIRFGLPLFFLLITLASISGGASLWFSTWRGMVTDNVIGLE